MINEKLSHILIMKKCLWVLLRRRGLYALIVTSPDILLRIARLKEVEKKVKDPNKRNESNLRRRKGSIRQMQPMKPPLVRIGKMIMQLHSSISTALL